MTSQYGDGERRIIETVSERHSVKSRSGKKPVAFVFGIVQRYVRSDTRPHFGQDLQSPVIRGIAVLIILRGCSKPFGKAAAQRVAPIVERLKFRNLIGQQPRTKPVEGQVVRPRTFPQAERPVDVMNQVIRRNNFDIVTDDGFQWSMPIRNFV